MMLQVKSTLRFAVLFGTQIVLTACIQEVKPTQKARESQQMYLKTPLELAKNRAKTQIVIFNFGTESDEKILESALSLQTTARNSDLPYFVFDTFPPKLTGVSLSDPVVIIVNSHGLPEDGFVTFTTKEKAEITTSKKVEKWANETFKGNVKPTLVYVACFSGCSPNAITSSKSNQESSFDNPLGELLIELAAEASKVGSLRGYDQDENGFIDQRELMNFLASRVGNYQDEETKTLTSASGSNPKEKRNFDDKVTELINAGYVLERQIDYPASFSGKLTNGANFSEKSERRLQKNGEVVSEYFKTVEEARDSILLQDKIYEHYRDQVDKALRQNDFRRADAIRQNVEADIAKIEIRLETGKPRVRIKAKRKSNRPGFQGVDGKVDIFEAPDFTKIPIEAKE